MGRLSPLLLAAALMLPSVGLAAPSDRPPAKRAAVAELQRPATSGRAWVELQLVRASRTAGPSDPSLEPIARQLRSRGFKSFRRVDSERERLAPHEKTAVKGGKRTARVTLLSTDRTLAKIRLVLLDDGRERTRSHLTLTKGKALLVRVGAQGADDLFATVVVSGG